MTHIFPNCQITAYITTHTFSNFHILVNRVREQFGYTVEEAKHEISMLLVTFSFNFFFFFAFALLVSR